MPSRSIGGACSTDSDCVVDLVCIGSDSDALDGAGIANGLCTAECSDAPARCREIDPRSVCVAPGDRPGPALCLEACVLGTPGPIEVKCHERQGLACAALSGADGVGSCTPTCASDADCSPRHCDPASGLCVDSPPGGAPTGAPCGAGLPPCAGLCVELATGYHACTGVCTLGTVGCGASAEQEGPFDAFCGLSLSPNDGLGDEGLCVALCDCNDDCMHSNAVCERIRDPDLETALGHPGACVPSMAGDAGATSSGIACRN
jgi:hypothetical protein